MIFSFKAIHSYLYQHDIARYVVCKSQICNLKLGEESGTIFQEAVWFEKSPSKISCSWTI